MATKQYDNAPLDTSGPSFRLLKVQAPTGKDREIRCSLRHHRIDGAQFRAVSYVWDPDSDVVFDQRTGRRTVPLRYRIYIDGKPYIIRQNLYRFLRVAQRYYADTNLWIDALCINQLDIKELNHQVGQMETIYTHAKEVISWLGPGDASTDAFLDFINESTEERIGRDPFKHMIEQGLFRRNHHVCKKSCTICQRFPSIAPGFKKVLTNEYWGRMWIVQEVILAKELSIVCGSRRVPLSAITNPLAEQPHWEGCIELSIGAKEMASLTVFKRNWWPGELPLCEMAQKFRRQKCFNPHDRLYALLGLTLDSEAIEVDYSRTTAELMDYAFSRITWSNYLYAPMVAEAIGVKLSEATSALPAHVLDRKFAVREETLYARLKAGKRAGEAIIPSPSGSKLFWPSYDRTKLIPCQRLYCKVYPLTYPPRAGDLVLKLPRMELQAIFRPERRSVNDNSPSGVLQLRFICCMCSDAHLWRNNQILSYCPVDDALHKQLKQLAPTVVSWGPQNTAVVDWSLDWGLIFSIWRFTNFERLVTTEALTGPPTAPRWVHGDQQVLRSVERSHDGSLSSSTSGSTRSTVNIPVSTPDAENKPTSVLPTLQRPPSRQARRQMRTILADVAWDTMEDAPRTPIKTQQ